jgi:hypothetical protein
VASTATNEDADLKIFWDTTPIFTLNKTGALDLAVELADTEISDILTASKFVGSGSLTDAVDLATAEVAGVLPDANVADSLTISGGTINNTPIGQATPAAGSFTTLSSTGSTTLGDAGTDTVTINANTLTLSNAAKSVSLANVANALNIDSGTLSIDALNNRVGIGTTGPTSTLEVASGKTINFNSSPVSNLVLGTNMGFSGYSANGILELESVTNNSFFLTGNRNTAGADAITLRTRNSANSPTPRLIISGFEDTADIQFLNSNVGIGTTAPGAPLEVFSTINPQVKISYNASTNTTLTTESDGDFRILPSGNFLRVGKATSLENDLYMNSKPIYDIGNTGTDITSTSYFFGICRAFTSNLSFKFLFYRRRQRRHRHHRPH